MKHIWTILCKNSCIDKESNNLSLFGIIEQFNITISPEMQSTLNKKNKLFPLPQFEIISSWEKEAQGKEEKTVIIDFVDEKDKTISSFKQNLVILPNNTRMRSIIKVQKLGVKNEGLHYFIIKTMEKNITKELARIPLEIKISIKIN